MHLEEESQNDKRDASNGYYIAVSITKDTCIKQA
jgi:hypothetical protein